MRFTRHCVVAATALLVGAPVALGSPHRTPGSGVGELWSQFPLTTPPTAHRTAHPGVGGHPTAKPVPAPTAPARTKPRSPAGAKTRDSWAGGGILVAMGSVGIAVAALAAVLLLRRTSSNTEGGAMPDFRRAHGRKEGKDEVENRGTTGWGVSTTAGSYGVRAGDDAETPHRSVGSDGDDLTTEPTEHEGPSMAGVGEHVASVLAAAEAAAKKIRAAAESEAKETGQEAARAAAEIRSRATEEAQRERAASRRLVDEAEAASHSVRSEADRYADERRREADAEAVQTLRDAERRAAAIADTSAERHRVLLANIAESETRLRQLAESLRGVAASLDDVVGDGDDPGAGREDGSEQLEDALRISGGQREETSRT